MVIRLKLAAKLGLSAASLTAVYVPAPPAGLEAPQTIALEASTIAYRVAGDFQEDRRTVDAPLQTRAIPSLRIMKYQLNGGQYDACVAERACPARARSESLDPRFPAASLSYEDARAYAAWLSDKTGETWRLPSDEEWRAAAGSRARDDALGLSKYADPSDRWLARYDAESAAARDDERLRPLGSFGVNERGLADLSGNVWEWTQSCFVRYAVDGGVPRAVTTNCGVRVVEGEHRAYVVDFIRDARAGGCAVGKPPAHLGVRLVREERTLAARVRRSLSWI